LGSVFSLSGYTRTEPGSGRGTIRLRIVLQAGLNCKNHDEQMTFIVRVMASYFILKFHFLY